MTTGVMFEGIFEKCLFYVYKIVDVMWSISRSLLMREKWFSQGKGGWL